MKALNRAALSVIAAILPLNAMAVLPSGQPVSQTIQMLQADPLLVHTLDISADEKNELMDQVIRSSQKQNTGNNPLIHRANFFERFFGGSPQPTPQYGPRGQNPIESQAPAPRPAPDARAIKMPQAPTEPAVIFDHESMKDPNDWKVKYFDVVVVINKARSGQTLEAYSRIDGGMPTLVIKKAKISTGREKPELSNEDRAAAGMPWSDHAPRSSYFSNTPTGYFTPIRFSIDHVSQDWEDAAMDHAVFFHPRGIATHRTPFGTEGELGQRASGACIRMFRSEARELFWLIRRTGGPVTDGELAGGNFERSEPGPSFERELKTRVEKGFNTYSENPSIPVFDRNGKITYALGEDGRPLLDTEGHPIPVMRSALARTLIVVENRELARSTTSRR